MPTEAVLLNMEGGPGLAGALDEVRNALDPAAGEVILDFSLVRRIDAACVRALEELARVAADSGIKVVLSGVQPDIYKALKLMKLTQRLSFVN
jgi:anti-anti-sigma regulatory factor